MGEWMWLTDGINVTGDEETIVKAPIRLMFPLGRVRVEFLRTPGGIIDRIAAFIHSFWFTNIRDYHGMNSKRTDMIIVS